MTTFLMSLLDRYEGVNRRLFENGITSVPDKPTVVEVVHAAYADTAEFDVEDMLSRVTVLVTTRLGDCPGDLHQSLGTCVRDREVDLYFARLSKDKTIVGQAVASPNGVLIHCEDNEAIDPRLRDLATQTGFAAPSRQMLPPICRTLWRDYKSDMLRGVVCADKTLTDILIAARGATSSDSFFDRLGRVEDAPPSVDQPVQAKRGPAKLSELAGFGPARDWGLRLARDIRDYRAGRLEWADVDNGLLLSSPPGGGKTMFAQALAAECECEFIPTQYSEWEGSDSRITKGMEKLFASVRDKGAVDPVVFFIDEIDSMGARGDNGHNESWWTSIINTLLAFLDGSVARTGVIVVAATNYPDKVDSALRRPGRLDRHVVIPYPTVREIEGILAHHLKAGQVDLATPARALRGRSPADVMQVARDARRHARGLGRDVGTDDVIAVLPPTRANLADDRIVCVHEAGHVIGTLEAGVPLTYVDADRCLTVSDLPPSAEIETFNGLLRQIMAGRAAEEVILGDPGIGCGSDLQQANVWARRILFETGRTGLVYRGPDHALWPSDVALLDTFLTAAYDDAKAMIERRKGRVLAVTHALRERRYLSGEEIDALLARRRRSFFEVRDDRIAANDACWGEAAMADPRMAAA